MFLDDMPYKCIHCSEIYEDGSDEVITGCTKCKSKFFFYIKREKLQEILANTAREPQLTEEEKDKMEQNVRDIIGLKNDRETSVFLDFESVKVVKPGKYLLDLERLFSLNKPRVYQLEDGKYIVDLMTKDKKE
mgnify:CR=1 FL=1